MHMPPSFYCHSIEMLFFSIQICPDKLLCSLSCEELPALLLLGMAQAGFAMVSGQGWHETNNTFYHLVICIVIYVCIIKSLSDIIVKE